MLREIVAIETISKEEDFVFIKSEFGFRGEENVLAEYGGTAEIIVVPEKTDSFGVAGGEKSVFRYPELVKKVVLNEGVTSIGDYAFCGCSNLEEILIPESVEFLWYSCSVDECSVYDLEKMDRSHIFRGCTSLKKVVFEPEAWGCEDICDALFKNCISLQDVKLPETITWIGKHMFEGCVALEEITIPDNVAVIGPYAFKNCKNLKRVHIPNHPLAIHPTSFQGTQFHPPLQYTRDVNIKRCPVCGGKLSYMSQCKKCWRQICYCGGEKDWK